MKKLKINLIMIAAILGIAGAVATKTVANTNKANDQPYTWTVFDENGNPIRTDNDKTIDEEILLTGCNSNGNLCAQGTAPGLPMVSLFYNN